MALATGIRVVLLSGMTGSAMMEYSDIDSELLITMQNGIHLQFDFKSQVDIKGIISNIQKYIL